MYATSALMWIGMLMCTAGLLWDPEGRCAHQTAGYRGDSLSRMLRHPVIDLPWRQALEWRVLVLASCEESAAAIWSGAWALNDDDHLHADVVLSWPPGLPRKSLRRPCHRTQGVSPADSNRKTGCFVRPLPSGFSPEAPASPSAQQADLAFVHMHLRIEP